MTPKSIKWHSSYEENNYGDLFYSLVRVYQPEKIVELGTKTGYSAYHMARGLKANGHGTLDCYDLFEKFVEYYGINSSAKSVAQKNLSEYKDIVNIRLADAIGIDKKYKSVDILHVDLENNDRILEMIVPNWIDKVQKLIIIEGGSKTRDEADLTQDQVKMPAYEWVNTLDKKKKESLEKVLPNINPKYKQFVVLGGNSKFKNAHIGSWVKGFCKKHNNFEYFTFEPFPSLTILRKI